MIKPYSLTNYSFSIFYYTPSVDGRIIPMETFFLLFFLI